MWKGVETSTLIKHDLDVHRDMVSDFMLTSYLAV